VLAAVRPWLGSRAVRVAGVAVLLGGLLFAGDRLAGAAAAGLVADRVACAAGLDARPAVSFGAVPFLPQLATGRLVDVRVVAHHVRRGDVTVDTVDAHLHGLSLPAGDRMAAAHVSIDLTVGYGVLPPELAGHPVGYRAVAGRLAVDTTTTVAGRPLAVTILVEPRIDGTTLTLTPREVQVLGVRAPLDVLPPGTGAAGELSRPLPALPAGLRYRSLTATEQGLRLAIDGDNVSAATNGKCGAR
jgi:LmeA-like phospholipid-binding